MGIIDFITNSFSPAPTVGTDLLPYEKKLLSKIARINASGGDITADLYQQLRDYEISWLERHYDFNTLDGISSIPVSNKTPGAPSPGGSPISGHTGEVYYYLRHKAYRYEESGNNDLALASDIDTAKLSALKEIFSSKLLAGLQGKLRINGIDA